MTNFWNDLPQPFFILAPMEAVTDVVFRHVVAAAAPPDVYFTEFTNAASYCSPKGEHSTRGRLAFTPDEQPIVAQIWGNSPEHFAQMSRGLAQQGFAGIDINMGCPDKTVVKNGSCSALILQPELAAELIAAAKAGGLPVSVKTRLGYNSTNEWRDWLTHLLKQDIVNLTVHLRTRKEMSKVPAHYELISEIKRLRDEVAPETLLTINGDIEDRVQGEALVQQYGVDGIMIGRGVFHNPFAFAPVPVKVPLPSSQPQAAARRSLDAGPATKSAPSFEKSGDFFKSGAAPLDVTRLSESSDSQPLATSFSEGSALPAERGKINGQLAPSVSSASGTAQGNFPMQTSLQSRSSGPAERGTEEKDGGEKAEKHSKNELLTLLNLHLDLFDKYSKELEPRKYEPLKRFFKIYVRDFPGASELREQLMHTKSTDEVRAILREL